MEGVMIASLAARNHPANPVHPVRNRCIEIELIDATEAADLTVPYRPLQVADFRSSFFGRQFQGDSLCCIGHRTGSQLVAGGIKNLEKGLARVFISANV